MELPFALPIQVSKMPTGYCALCGEDMDTEEAYKQGRSFFKRTYHMCGMCLQYSNDPENPWISDLDEDTGKAEDRRKLAAWLKAKKGKGAPK